MALRARPTLTNPLTYTSVSQLPAHNGYKHIIQAGGRDVYVSIPAKMSRGIHIAGARNAIVLGMHIEYPFNSERSFVQNPPKPNSGYDAQHVITFTGCTGSLHVEGCFLDANFWASDCIAINTSPAVLTVQNCRVQKNHYAKAHGDCIHVQGASGDFSKQTKALYVENFNGFPSNQGFQLPVQMNLATGPRYCSLKNVCLSKRGLDRVMGTMRLTHFGNMAHTNDKPWQDGGSFDEVYLEWQVGGYTGMISGNAPAMNGAAECLQNSNGWVYYPAKYNYSGFIKPGFKEFVPASKVGLNYDRSYYDGGTIITNTNHNVTGVVTTESHTVAEVTLLKSVIGPTPPVVTVPFPSAPGEGEVVTHSAEGILSTESEVNGYINKIDVAGATGVLVTESHLYGEAEVEYTEVGQNAGATLTAESYLLATSRLEGPQDDDDYYDDSDDYDEGDYIDDYDDPTPVIIPESLYDKYDVVKTRDPLESDRLKELFATNTRPASTDWFTLIDSLVTPQYETLYQNVQGREGVIYIESSLSAAVITPGAYGAGILGITDATAFAVYASGGNFNIYASADVSIGTEKGMVGGGNVSDNLVLMLDTTGSGGRYDLMATDFKLDDYSRVVQTRVNTTALGFEKTFALTTAGAFNTMNLVSMSALRHCAAIDIAAGPFRSAVSNTYPISLRVGVSAAMDTTNYRSFVRHNSPGVCRSSSDGFVFRAGTGLTDFFLNAQIVRATVGNKCNYYLEGMSMTSSGDGTWVSGSVSLSTALQTIQIVSSATASSPTGRLTLPSSCRVYVRGRKGGNLSSAPIVYTEDILDRRVFVWLVAQNFVYSNTQEGYNQEVTDALRLGFDGFGVEMVPSYNTTYLNSARTIIQAAENATTPFYVYPIINYSSVWPTGKIAEYVKFFADSPAGYKVDGDQVVGLYLGHNATNQEWNDLLVAPLAAQGIGVHIHMMLWGQTPAEMTTAYPDAASAFNWAVEHSDLTLARTRGYYEAWVSAKPFSHDLSTNFALVPQPGRTTYNIVEHYGAEELATGYEFIIQEDPSNKNFVTVLNWNGFGEDTHICDASVVVNRANLDVPSYTHRGFSRLAQFYNEWYKKGVRPSLDNEFAILSYRPHSVDASAPGTDEYTGTFDIYPAEGLTDAIFVTTVLKDAAKVKVVVAETTTSAEVTSGVQHVRGTYGAGKPTVQIIRNSVTVMEIEGLVSIEAEPQLTRCFSTYSDYIGG